MRIEMKKGNVVAVAIIALAVVCEYFDIFKAMWGLTDAQEISCAILLIVATLWVSELVPLFVTSFIVILLQTIWLLPEIVIEGRAITKQAFLSPFFSDIILLFMGGFVLSSMLHKYQLDQRMARWILGRTEGSPDRLLLAVILISAFLSMWMSNTATAAMMFAIILPIIYKLPEGSPFALSLTLAIPFACNLGGLGTPIGTPPNAIAISYLAENGIKISFAQWMLLAMPLVVVLLALLWRFLLLAYPANEIHIEFEGDNGYKLSTQSYFIIAIFLVTCVGWLSADLHGMSTGTVSLIPIILCFGLGLLNTQDFKSLSWDVLFMLGGGLSLGVGLKASGLTDELIQVIPTGTDLWIIVAVMAGLGALMSTFISNTATANLMIPIAVSLEPGAALVVMTVAISCSSAMALPVSTPPNAIAFGSGIVSSRDMMGAGAVVTLVALALTLTVGELYWSILGIL